MRLSDIASISSGLPVRGAVQPDRSGDAILLQMKDVDPVGGIDWDGAVRISTEKFRSPGVLESGDVLFVGRGVRFFGVCVQGVTSKSVASPHFLVLRGKEGSGVLPEFLSWYLGSKFAQKFYAMNQEGSSLSYISSKVLGELPVKIPDIATQKKIVDIYDCWKKQKQLLNKLIKSKDGYVNAVLNDVLEGEIK